MICVYIILEGGGGKCILCAILLPAPLHCRTQGFFTTESDPVVGWVNFTDLYNHTHIIHIQKILRPH